MPCESVHGQAICKHLARGLCARLHGARCLAIGAQRERDACASESMLCTAGRVALLASDVTAKCKRCQMSLGAC